MAEISTSVSSFLLVVMLVAVILLIVLIKLVIDMLSERKALVERSSTKLAGMKELNEVFIFSPIKEEHNLFKDCSSKMQYDRQRGYDFLVACALESPKWLEEIVFLTERNRILFEEYSGKVAQLKPTPEETIEKQGVLIGTNAYRRMEDRMCEKLVQHPVVRAVVNVTVSYTSKKGMNHYEKREQFGVDALKQALADANRQTKYQESRQYQRSLMTPKLRYDVMKRDGFRCRLCGASQKDGVRLEVDHIRPVSKGGKTEMSNLRTLCERCNRGKRDHYDPNGPN